MRAWLKRILDRIYGTCATHGDRLDSFLGCISCFREHAKKVRHEIREEKIELIKEGVKRALLEARQ